MQRDAHTMRGSRGPRATEGKTDSHPQPMPPLEPMLIEWKVDGSGPKSCQRRSQTQLSSVCASMHPPMYACTCLCVHLCVFILSSLTGEYCAGGYEMTRAQSLSWRPSQSREETHSQAQDSVIG